MKKSTKSLLGIASFWPVVYLFLFMTGWVVFLSSILRSVSAGRPPTFTEIPPSSSAAFFFMVFLIHMLTITGALGLAAFYIVDMFKHDRVKNDMRVAWLLLLVLLAVFTLPVYWYLHIKQLPEPS